MIVSSDIALIIAWKPTFWGIITRNNAKHKHVKQNAIFHSAVLFPLYAECVPV